MNLKTPPTIQQQPLLADSIAIEAGLLYDLLASYDIPVADVRYDAAQKVLVFPNVPTANDALQAFDEHAKKFWLQATVYQHIQGRALSFHPGAKPS